MKNQNNSIHLSSSLTVMDLVNTYQSAFDMIYQIYREDPTVLQEGQSVSWEPKKQVLRGLKQHVLTEYAQEFVYRWEVNDSIMRICLGSVHDPDPETVKSAARYFVVEDSKTQLIEALHNRLHYLTHNPSERETSFSELSRIGFLLAFYEPIDSERQGRTRQ